MTAKRKAGRPKTDGGVARVHLSLRLEAMQILQRHAAKEGLHISQAATELIKAGAKELAR